MQKLWKTRITLPYHAEDQDMVLHCLSRLFDEAIWKHLHVRVLDYSHGWLWPRDILVASVRNDHGIDVKRSPLEIRNNFPYLPPIWSLPACISLRILEIHGERSSQHKDIRRSHQHGYLHGCHSRILLYLKEKKYNGEILNLYTSLSNSLRASLETPLTHNWEDSRILDQQLNWIKFQHTQID